MHTNTKHQQEELKCENFSNIFHIKNVLYLHIEEEHQDEPEMQKQQEQRECSLCEDKFITSIECNMHVKEHLDEIRYIDFDNLKNGCEIFNCIQKINKNPKNK